MKHLLTALLLCIAHVETRAQAQSLVWLVGCWETPDGSSREVWVRESDSRLMGFGVAIEDNAVVYYELLKVEQKDNGDVLYTAFPAGQSPTTFTAKDRGERSIVFENPQHDYPQLIAYRRESDRLLASIAAIDGANKQAFNKQACQ